MGDFLAVSHGGKAETYQTVGVAVSTTGCADGGVVGVSGTGPVGYNSPASSGGTTFVAFSGTNCARAFYVAVSPLGCADGGYVAVGGGGPADGVVGISGTGNASGSSSLGVGVAVSVTGDADGDTLSLSVLGDGG